MASKPSKTTTKAAVKETETKVEAAKTEASKKEATVKTEAPKKEAAKVEAPKAEAAKAEAPKKETAKKAPAKKAPAKKEVAASVYVQFAGKEIQPQTILAQAKDDFVAAGNKASDIKTVALYIKPEEDAAYWVINDEATGKIAL
jgi:hypothetical protein